MSACSLTAGRFLCAAHMSGVFPLASLASISAPMIASAAIAVTAPSSAAMCMGCPPNAFREWTAARASGRMSSAASNGRSPPRSAHSSTLSPRLLQRVGSPPACSSAEKHERDLTHAAQWRALEPSASHAFGSAGGDDDAGTTAAAAVAVVSLSLGAGCARCSSARTRGPSADCTAASRLTTDRGDACNGASR